ncbi:MAG: glycosyltransferase family 25 protein [Alphaproteobacteria bacterium]|nr:glycosyltransferase family 25 protein [Alphaproteobacteria bacterium]
MQKNDVSIYVINMKQATERRHHMQTLLNGLGYNYEFFEAVDGHKVTESDLSDFRHIKNSSLFKGEIGCLLSHLGVWKTFLQSGLQYAIVLEDDLHFSPRIKTVLENLQSPRDDFFILRLETFFHVVEIDCGHEKTMPVSGDYFVGRCLSTQVGTGAYIVNRNTAEFLVSAIKYARHAVDVELFSNEQRSIPQVPVYQIFPAICIQDKVLEESERTTSTRLPSTIGDQRQLPPGPKRAFFDAIPETVKSRLRKIKQVLRASWIEATRRKTLKLTFD